MLRDATRKKVKVPSLNALEPRIHLDAHTEVETRSVERHAVEKRWGVAAYEVPLTQAQKWSWIFAVGDVSNSIADDLPPRYGSDRSATGRVVRLKVSLSVVSLGVARPGHCCELGGRDSARPHRPGHDALCARSCADAESH